MVELKVEKLETRLAVSKVLLKVEMMAVQRDAQKVELRDC